MNLLKNPWLTNGILKSMKARDRLHSRFLKLKDPVAKDRIFIEFKRKRNLINSLVRESKIKHYNDFFTEFSNNAKKHGKESVTFLRYQQKTDLSPKKLKFGTNTLSDPKHIADSFNDFFVNIGTTVDNKIPKSR